jgi:tetratricopeptide (TPR) repeat protein
MLFRIAVLLFLIASPSFAATQSVQWVRDYDQALAKAAKDAKPIFVDAYADWCMWCHKLDQEVYSDPNFVKFMNNFVALKIDVESTSKGRQFAEKYQITGLPTLFVLDSSGKISNRIGGFIEAAALIEDIQSMQRLIEAEQKDPSNVNVAGMLADEYLAREMTDEATMRFRKIVISPNSTPGQKESAQFSLGLAYYSQGDLNNAQKVIEQYLQSFPQGEDIEDGYLLIAQICIEKGEEKRARRYLQQFLEKFPQSTNISRAKDVLTALESGGEQSN